MRRQTILAFEMLEKEMECIATEELQMYIGGTGEGDYGSGVWLVTGSGVWDTDFSSTGFYGSGGYYSSGYYGSGDSGSTGSYGSGDSSSSGMAPEDPRQAIDSYVNTNGGWENWSGGFISGYGYMGPTTTISAGGSSGIENNLMSQIDNTVSNIFNAAGWDASLTSVLTQNIAGEQLTSFSFKQVGNMLKFVGTAATGADIIFNIKEIATEDQTAVQYIEDFGQIGLNVVGLFTEEVGIGFGLNCILAVWEMDEATNGR